MALCTAANDRFYIEDFTITPGETCTVSILLDNETQYTAFQTDVYLPDGLTIAQEDDEYIFDLTSRKSRDHNIASQLQYDGAIRVMSYSPNINAYKDNSGALVTFDIIASVDFSGPAVIALRNTLFTTTAGVEIAFSDEQCTVTVPATGNRGDVNDDGAINVGDVAALIEYLLTCDDSHISLYNADVNADTFINVSDIPSLIAMLLAPGK